MSNPFNLTENAQPNSFISRVIRTQTHQPMNNCRNIFWSKVNNNKRKRQVSHRWEILVTEPLS